MRSFKQSVKRAAVAGGIALGCMVAAGAPARAQEGAGLTATQSKLMALENAWGQAEEHGDAKTLNGLLDGELVYVRYDGTVWNRGQYLASLKEPGAHEDQAVNEAMSAHVFGETAIVTGIYRVKGVEKGKAYARRERYIDTWVNRDGAWVCVASQVTLITR